MKRLFSLYNREISVGIAIVIMFIIFSLINVIYISPDNLIDIVNQSIIYGLMALGVTGIIIIGGIDLSMGSALALVVVLVSKLSVAGFPPITCLIIGLLFGLVLGYINGILVAKLRLQPFIATLGTMSLYRGMALLIAGGLPILNIPDAYRRFVDARIIWYVRVSVIIFIIFAIFLHILLKKTRFGNYVFAIGGNEEASRLSGVKVEKVKIAMYSIGMLGTTLAAMIMIGKMGAGDSTTGVGYELDAIAAAAIGGTSMSGGRGTIVGTLLGALLFASLRIGLIVAGVDPFWQYVARGIVILIAAYLEIAQGNIMILRRTKKEA